LPSGSRTHSGKAWAHPKVAELPPIFVSVRENLISDFVWFRSGKSQSFDGLASGIEADKLHGLNLAVLNLEQIAL
jgi:hypothetical protein